MIREYREVGLVASLARCIVIIERALAMYAYSVQLVSHFGAGAFQTMK